MAASVLATPQGRGLVLSPIYFATPHSSLNGHSSAIVRLNSYNGYTSGAAPYYCVKRDSNPRPAIGFQKKPHYSSVDRIRAAVEPMKPPFNVHIAGSSEVTKPWKTADARLVLEDGSVWNAKSFGASGTQVGEVVFNTSLTGYQEILTDPSYAGQFVLMTNPHIGNTGVNVADEESNKCFLAGLVIRNLSNCVSNWRSTESLPEYLTKRNVMGIYDVDTRAITRRLRQDGSLIGVLSTDSSKSDDELLNMARKWDIVGMDLITGVTCAQPYEWKDTTGTEWDFNTDGIFSDKLHVVAYDFGIKHNILRRLASYGCKITVVPSTWAPSEVLKLSPDGVLFSNGPGDPSAVPYAVENVKYVLGKVPVFGICMGHQLLGQALGGKTFKMKFGHHGGNHPVRNLRSGRVEISAQNHNYAVDPATLPEGVEVTHVNLNDGTCAGLAFPALNAMSLQYHPEASPGPHDSDPSFFEFVQLMRENKQTPVIQNYVN